MTFCKYIVYFPVPLTIMKSMTLKKAKKTTPSTMRPRRPKVVLQELSNLLSKMEAALKAMEGMKSG